MSTTVQEALAVQRGQIKYNTQKLSQFLYGKKQYQVIKKFLNQNQPLPYDFNIYQKGRVQIIKQSIRDLPHIANTIKGELSLQNSIYMLLTCMNQAPGTVHIGMFMRCIDILGTDQQRKQYLQKCKSFQVMGCYAQTQMGHGSDVSSLLTTATFNQQTDSFTLDNSSDIKAIKFWPGDMGLLATHALVFAQLIIKGKSHGVHAFICQIRDQNLNLMPGVQAGDIGPKIGFYSKDNGYLILKNIKIPRKNMLRRFISVSKKGQLKIKGDPKVSYATMMQIRKYISCIYPKVYSSAITIAARYSIFRRQFKNSKGEQIKIIDYQLQQQKILDRVAEYYAITAAGNNIGKMCAANLQKVSKQDFSLMAQTHACLCLGKPYFSQIVYDGMQIARKACGGHGFSHYSGFPSLINEYACNLTHQGQNTVLYLQVARYLMKGYKGFMVKNKKLDESISYLSQYSRLIQKKCNVNDQNWNLQNLRQLIAQSVCYIITNCVQKLVGKQQGMSDKQVYNQVIGLSLKNLGIHHAGYYTFDSFKKAVQQQNDKKIKQLTNDLCLLFGINFILSHSLPIIQGGYITSEQITSLQQLKQSLLRKLRPQLIGLVDGFGIPDKYIRSALIFGNPYQNYLNLARSNQVNKSKLKSTQLIKNIKNHLKNPDPSL